MREYIVHFVTGENQLSVFLNVVMFQVYVPEYHYLATTTNKKYDHAHELSNSEHSLKLKNELATIFYVLVTIELIISHCTPLMYVIISIKYQIFVCFKQQTTSNQP
jgi:hypothetical protein